MRLIDADRFYNVLHDLGGCGAKSESYADGWDANPWVWVVEFERID